MGFWGWFKSKFNKKQTSGTKAQSKKIKNYNLPLKFGLALSGGGTRGIAYIGVFRALNEAGINFDYVAGTSVGSLMGAAYCANMSIEKMTQVARTLRVRDVKMNKIPYAPSKTDRLRAVIREALDNKGFEDLNKPFTAVAVDIISGEEKHLTGGSLDTAIAGSCAVPGVFYPVEFGSYRLFDGGLRNNIPADVVREMGADIVISFDINPTRGYGTDSLKYLDVMKAALRIMMKANSVNGYVHSDYIVKIDLSKFKQTKLDDIDEMIKVGYDSTIAEFPNILKALGKITPNEEIKKTAKKLKAIAREAKKEAKKEAKMNKSKSRKSVEKSEETNAETEEQFQEFISKQTDEKDS